MKKYKISKIDDRERPWRVEARDGGHFGSFRTREDARYRARALEKIDNERKSLAGSHQMMEG